MLPAHQNPLRMELIAAVPFRFRHGDWPTNLGWLKRLNYRAAIVGPKGSGKTTLLAELAERLDNSLYLNLPHEKQPHAAMLADARAGTQAGKIILVDGIERLSWLQRQTLYFGTAGKAGLVVVVHRKCRLPTWITCRTDEQLLTHVLKQLGLDKPEVHAAALKAFHLTRGNIRDALRLVYDQFADESLPASASPVAIS